MQPKQKLNQLLIRIMLNVCFHIGIMLSLLQSSHQSCMTGTAKQCQEAEFAPGTNLAGEGFDITKMASKGAFVIDVNLWKNKDNTCKLCTNPYMEGKKQKLPQSVLDWRSQQSCRMKVSSSVHRSSEALVTSSSSSVDNNWKMNLNLDMTAKASLMMAGTHSKLAEYSMEKSKSDKFSYTSHSISCEYYSYRISNSPKLHREFRAALNKLPKTYSAENKLHYYKLIDTFGTHFINKVKLGGSVHSVTSIRQCQASLHGISVEEVQMCLDVEASASIGQINMETESKHCKKDVKNSESKSSFSSLFNDRLTEIQGGHTTEPEILFSADKDPSAFKEWLNSLPQLPGKVSYSLESLHELLPTNNPVRKNLRSAISHYILEKALMRNCSEPCQAGTKRTQNEPCVCSCHNDPAVAPDCCPRRKGTARVIITVTHATGLWGDHTTQTDGFVKVFFNTMTKRQTNVIYNDNNPKWHAAFDLSSQDLSAGRKVRFEVWDEDNHWDDDLLGECEKVLTAGVHDDVCSLPHGARLYFKWELKCAPSLGGEACMDYIPTPISQHLQKVFVSRHAQHIPEAILKEKGVFLGVSGLGSNQSITSTFSQHGEM